MLILANLFLIGFLAIVLQDRVFLLVMIYDVI